jgi:hypothetical protein
MVIGPTPPGADVIEPATWTASSKTTRLTVPPPILEQAVDADIDGGDIQAVRVFMDGSPSGQSGSDLFPA